MQLLVLAAAAAFASCTALPVREPPLNLWRAKQASRSRRWQEAEARARAGGILAPPPDLNFTQSLDHFDVFGAAAGSTWQQRYWVNASFYTPGGPAFVYVDGEGPGSPWSVVEGEHVDFASQYGALIVAIEHRFYGTSQPVPNVTTANLAYLSSHQAIADIARLLALQIIPQYNVTGPNARIVTFGGSYPGVLSAWTRLRLPHLVHAAFSTSSPVTSAVDYAGYNSVVGQAFANPVIGGSDKCYSVLSQGFAAMAAGFNGTADERHAMATKMSSCTGLDGVNDTMYAVDEYSNILKGIVQTNDEYENPAYDVQSICVWLTSDSSLAPVDALASWFKMYTMAQGQTCQYLNYTDFVAFVQQTETNATQWYRQWYWETCSQFGLSQTCDAGTPCPFSQLYPDAASNLQTCSDVFGWPMSAAVTADRVSFTNAYMGGRGLKPTRVLYVNGDVDPWHAASILTPDPANDIYAVLINGTAHCRNMLPPRPDDPPSLKKARVYIASALAAFMAAPLDSVHYV